MLFYLLFKNDLKIFQFYIYYSLILFLYSHFTYKDTINVAHDVDYFLAWNI